MLRYLLVTSVAGVLSAAVQRSRRCYSRVRANFYCHSCPVSSIPAVARRDCLTRVSDAKNGRARRPVLPK
jgi:hypothetical protein